MVATKNKEINKPETSHNLPILRSVYQKWAKVYLTHAMRITHFNLNVLLDAKQIKEYKDWRCFILSELENLNLWIRTRIFCFTLLPWFAG